jgi:hypothetical protein
MILVPEAGLEPARSKRSTDFKSVVSTDFTTRAEYFYRNHKRRWRRDPESNRTRWICNPEHNRFAIAPSREAAILAESF